MPQTPDSYFRYFPAAPDFADWGLGVTAAGFAHVPPGSPYPPAQHPADHHFDWTRGRVLDACQIVLIGAGRGDFETRATGRKVVEAGTAFVLMPKVWHRYRPDPATGWDESWIEVQGPIVDALCRARVLSAEEAVLARALAAGMDEAFEAVHARVRETHPGFDPELAARALGVLATWREAAQTHPAQGRTRRAVAEAERFLMDHLAEPVDMSKLAHELGIAYSHFRRAFRQHTGYAPWQYVLHLRLSRARRLLVSTHATLGEISERLGFSSPYHLSTVFKRAFGVAPDRWRRRFADGPPAERSVGQRP